LRAASFNFFITWSNGLGTPSGSHFPGEIEELENPDTMHEFTIQLMAVGRPHLICTHIKQAGHEADFRWGAGGANEIEQIFITQCC